MEGKFNLEESASHINESLFSNKIKVKTLKTLQFEAPMTAYFWVFSQQHENLYNDGTTWFWKSNGLTYTPDEVNGKNALGDYEQLHPFLTKYLGSEERLFTDFTIICEWAKVSGDNNNRNYQLEKPLYVGIVFDKIELIQRHADEKLYYVNMQPSQIFFPTNPEQKNE
jgi:hypothetical protein